ncbi:MAG: catechol 1,2-dioxygenase [Bacteroidota bacterium]
MERKTFLKNTALCAIAVSASGFIRFDGERYTGDCATTSDILGPFYRPGSPVRSDLAMTGSTGTPLQLTGKVLHENCRDPFSNARVELWHCDEKGVYDNASPGFNYRGTTFTNAKGDYVFKTILPVPYEIGNGISRPAHFHMMITAAGYQPLVTQLYFTGDAYIAKDAYASSTQAKSRILTVRANQEGKQQVVFNVGMSKKLPVEPASLDRLAGTYIDEKDPKISLVLFKNDNRLWLQNEVFGEDFEFVGDNRFQTPGMPAGHFEKLHFELLPTGITQLMYERQGEDGVKRTNVLMKKS